jgi:2-C-methyl-D-erythritol 4-phosphate cytidylyltransferase
MTHPSGLWALVPAAGVGRRLGSAIPKQYLELGGQRVLEHTLGRLLGHPRIAGVYVALSPEDRWWPQTRFARDPRVKTVPGGAERPQSVLRLLEALGEGVAAEDWVLVHDGVRPCVRAADIDRLIDCLASHPVGGLLGTPVRDTIKRADGAARVEATVQREGLWHAFTPQMFRLGALRTALRGALAAGIEVTDEAAAMEWAGLRPELVEGAADNLKITRPEDLALAVFFLEQQETPC